MKIRFSSPKERHPTQENGLDVLYAPSKRLGFRLRWYLVVMLILLPAVWLAGHYGLDLVRIEAPALIRLSTLELRARQPGQVVHLAVKPGEHVERDALLVEMDNPEWRLRLALLPDEPLAPMAASTADVATRNRAVLQALVGRARQRVAEVQRLLRAGAATRGELSEAQNARDAREAELLAFERSVTGSANGVTTDQRYVAQQRAERQWLEGQLGTLQLRAPLSGRVAEVMAVEGENVGPGTPLLRLERNGPAQLWIYLNPSDVAYSAPGTQLDVHLPDGTWRRAEVRNPAESADPLPTDLRKPFSSPTRGLLVLAQFVEPLPNEWQVDSLPVEVRFPGRHLKLFDWFEI